MSPSEPFDTQLANDLARLEAFNKHHYRPNTYLHKWWARRCGTTFRLLLKHLAAMDGHRDYYEGGGLEGTIVLDPMMGGGTTLHEAIRMGANVIGFDLDPIPVVQAKASLSATDLSNLEEAYEALYDELDDSLAPVFTSLCPVCSKQSRMRYMLYGQRRRCGCDDVIMVDSLVLREEMNDLSISLCQTCHSVIPAGGKCKLSHTAAKPQLIVKGSKTCPKCNQTYEELTDLPYYKRYSPLTVISDCHEHGVLFGSVDDYDLGQLEQADRARSKINFDESLQIEIGPKSIGLHRKRIDSYDDLFSSRQLLYLQKAINLLQKVDYPAHRFLSLLVSTSLEFNSMLCGYKGARKRRAGAIRHSFSHHGYTFPYTALEANPVYPARTSGTLAKLFHDRIRKARAWSLNPRERVIGGRVGRFLTIEGEVDRGTEINDPGDLKAGKRRFLVRQLSATSLPLDDGIVDFVVTDPPYFDSVQYADLSAFFRVWLKQLSNTEGEPDIEWDYDLISDAVSSDIRSDNIGRAERYTRIMGQVFLECRRVLRPESGRLALTFHHWDPLAWASLTTALARARFELLELHVVHSENPISVHIANMRALTDDAILILASSQTERELTWAKPAKISYESSAEFCHDCATLLGWMLSSKQGEEDIGLDWQQMLRSR
ncbi:MAG TPA: hypothetical protein VFI27_15175 [candidate division Zixibacteria bacterium]|nr:hypothetical protein [candidate division Zixibacteria bacterium]